MRIQFELLKLFIVANCLATAEKHSSPSSALEGHILRSRDGISSSEFGDHTLTTAESSGDRTEHPGIIKKGLEKSFVKQEEDIFTDEVIDGEITGPPSNTFSKRFQKRVPPPPPSPPPSKPKKELASPTPSSPQMSSPPIPQPLSPLLPAGSGTGLVAPPGPSPDSSTDIPVSTVTIILTRTFTTGGAITSTTTQPNPSPATNPKPKGPEAPASQTTSTSQQQANSGPFIGTPGTSNGVASIATTTQLMIYCIIFSVFNTMVW